MSLLALTLQDAIWFLWIGALCYIIWFWQDNADPASAERRKTRQRLRAQRRAEKKAAKEAAEASSLSAWFAADATQIRSAEHAAARREAAIDNYTNVATDADDLSAAAPHRRPTSDAVVRLLGADGQQSPGSGPDENA